MDRQRRMRRVAILCCHFARNCAYYKASFDNNTTRATNEFWATVQGNFIDIAVLEWLKLFGDHNDRHHWKNLVENKVLFKEAMLRNCSINEEEFLICRESFKRYRDKFVAHLDSEDIMHIPKLDDAISLVKYYYSYVAKELKPSELQALPQDLNSYYQKCFVDSKLFFKG